MGSIVYRLVVLLAAGLIWGMATPVLAKSSAPQDAVSAKVTGTQIQKVGFRAMIQKQAIMYNLGGYARNNPDGSVDIALQGDKDRIDKALEAIRAGTKKSSKDNTITQTTAAVDPNLQTFTVFAWTSTTRNITNPYDLVFHLRPANDETSAKQAKAIWNTIAEGVLKGDDLDKFTKHLEEDE